MRALFLTPRPFWPPRRGEQARTSGFVSHLAHRHQVMTVSLVPPGFHPSSAPYPACQKYVPLRPIRAALGFMTHPWEPLQVALHRDPEVIHQLQTWLREFQPHVIVIMLARLGWLLPYLEGRPTVVDFVDSLTLNMRMRARFEPFMAPLWLWESWRLAIWEKHVLDRATAGTVVAARDRAAIARGNRGKEAKLEVVPFGVSVPDRIPPQKPKTPTLLTTGNLGYFPTVHGILWFAARVWPKLRKDHPGLRWVVAGARPSRRIQALAKVGVEVIPEPKTLEPLFEGATVAVAPLFAGSGTPIKVLEAMARGLPVVTTPHAAAGLDLLPAGALLLAKTPAQWYEAVTVLLEDSRRAYQQATLAHAWAKEHHDLPKVARQFEDLLLRIPANT